MGKPTILGRPMTSAERVRRHRAGKPKQERQRPPAPLSLARLRNIEYELDLRTAQVVERGPIEAELLAYAAALRSYLAQFAETYGGQIAFELQLPEEALAAALRGILSDFLADYLGTMEVQIGDALTQATAHWRRFASERGPEGPAPAPWVAPSSSAELVQRDREARHGIEELKLQVRSGEVLDRDDARWHRNDLIERWTYALTEELPVRAVPRLIGELQLAPEHGLQHRIHCVLASKARSLLLMVELDLTRQADAQASDAALGKIDAELARIEAELAALEGAGEDGDGSSYG